MIWILVGIALMLISFVYDLEILGVVSSIRGIQLDYILNSFTMASQAILVLFFLTTLFLWKEHKRKWIFPLWFTLLSCVVISFILKVLIHRTRPFETGIVTVFGLATYFLGESFKVWNFSFPSFQAMIVFSALPILDKEFPRFKWVWFGFAILAAFSRLYFGLHFLSDVLVGSFIGYLLGIGVLKVWKRLN